MGATLYGASNLKPSSAAGSRRSGTLALVYQEVLTATVRVRANRQAVTDSQAFRTQIQAALQLAERDGIGKGYTPEDVQLTTTAVIAFLDESILTTNNPVFSDWTSMPLALQLLGHNVAGESFFENLERLQSRSDSQDVADILELYGLCLLLGFRGRYARLGPEATRPVIDSIMNRIRRIRGPLSGLSPSWNVPDAPVATAKPDPWVRRLFVLAVVCLLAALLLFAGFRLMLSGGTTDLREFSVILRL
jgi:type VI secretion system protein ImpK